ncbi:MAG: LysR family transcriptional regulator [Mogibacterium sp.]|nr:LysR family transcriptional regulator [Mogibacterium sp.]
MNRYIAFLRIWELGSFTQAANALGYTQPAISQMITSLEKELGFPLLQRSRYGIQLTPEGERLLPVIRSTAQQYESLQSAADEVRGLVTGTIRIGVFPSVSNDWLTTRISRFWQDYPGIQFDLFNGDYSSIIRMVQTGELDFGFVNRDALPSTMSARIALQDEFVLVLPEGHPLAAYRKVPIAKLWDQPFLLLKAGDSNMYNESLDAFRRADIRPDIRLTAHDNNTIMTLIEQGCGISILAAKNLEHCTAKVISRPLDPPIRRDICLLARDRKALPVASRKFIEFLLS